MHVQWMRQPNGLYGKGQPAENMTGSQRLIGKRCIQIVMVASAAVLPESRSPWVGHLDSPAPAAANRLR